MQTTMHIEQDGERHIAYCGALIDVRTEWYLLVGGGGPFIQTSGPGIDPAPQEACAECVARKRVIESKVRTYVEEKLRLPSGSALQSTFDLAIGQLDNILSKLVLWGKDATLDEANKQTLKHHAEDMIAAGQKILKDLGRNVEGTPQPGEST